MSRVTVAAIQLTSTDDPQSNLARAEKLVRQGAEGGANIVALPENYAYLRSEGEAIPYLQSLEDEFVGRMKGLAAKFGIYLLCGSIPERIPESPLLYNTSVLLNPEGGIAAVYRKIHLFDINLEGRAVFQESRMVKPGSEVITAETRFGKTGLTICYDLRFPELYRRLALAGARIIFVPSAFTEITGRDHWEVLLRSRAIENQVFIVAPAQYGQHNPKRRSYGRAMIVDPWGNILAQAADREMVILAELDFDHQDEIRRQLPVLQHIRFNSIKD